jgi:hypothetical protein
VNVEELLSQLSNVSEFLRRAKAKEKIVDEMEQLCLLMQPYRERSVKDFKELLAKADEIVHAGATIKKPRSNSAATRSDPQAAAAAERKIVEYYHRATDPTITRELIEAAVAELEKTNPAKASLDALLKQIGVGQKTKSKKDALNRIAATILDRKGAFERVNA